MDTLQHRLAQRAAEFPGTAGLGSLIGRSKLWF